LGRGCPITDEQILFESELNRYILDVEQRLRTGSSLDELLNDVRREAVVAALRLHGHDHTRAAEQLKITVSELNEICRASNIDEGTAALSNSPAAPATSAR
ncbi:MAG TPA: hypothetical protein VET66_01920, partial [Steroidobacteraceae bacterium]|nr:hypothetical protein [Steroidobacteraceae bacterium]